MRRAPARLLTRAPVHSPEWFAARQGGIGGSEIAAVLGISPYCSARELWHRLRGDVEPWAGNASSERGNVIEPALLAELDRRHPDEHWRPCASVIYAHPDRPWQRASADALAYRTRRAHRPRKVGEAKVASGDGWKWGADGTDEIPTHYAAQVMQAMDVHGVDEARVIMDDGRAIREFVVGFDEQVAAYLRERAVAFLDSLTGDAPPPDASDRTYDVLRQVHPEIDGTTVEIDHDQAAAYVAAVRAARVAEPALKLAKNRMAVAMGAAQYAEYAGERLARRESKSGGLPYVKAYTRLPELEPPAAGLVVSEELLADLADWNPETLTMGPDQHYGVDPATGRLAQYREQAIP